MSEEQEPNDARRQAREWRRSAASLFKWTVLIVVGIPLVWFTFCEARKGYWDWRVTQMCEKDGGVSVLSTTFVSAEQSQRININNGHVSVAPKSLVREGDVLYSVANEVVLKSGSPSVVRREENVFRVDGEKHVGAIVIYSRRGGDSGFFSHPTSYSCPDQNVIRGEKDAFIVIGGGK